MQSDELRPCDGVAYLVTEVPEGMDRIYQGVGNAPLAVGDTVYVVETPEGYGMHNLFYRPATRSLHPMYNSMGECVVVEAAPDRPTVVER